jgi:hypothetical protein
MEEILGLFAGEIVEVLSKSEILATLDGNGALGALPFMPEMLKHCGRRFRVFKRAHKTCDTIEKTGLRRMNNAVHLEGVRCEGEAHGGCQAACLIFWKEAWLKRVGPNSEGVSTKQTSSSADTSNFPQVGKTPCTEATLFCATHKPAGPSESGQEVFSCQATELKRATSHMPWWDVRHYWWDIRSGNVRLSTAIVKAVRMILVSILNALQHLRGGRELPFLAGKLTKTPTLILGLKPGELVEIKSRKEIISTLDAKGKNRGLSFDVEMARYCGGQFRVRTRVERLINERTGKMMKPPNDCIILEGVACQGDLSHCRLFCPRSIYPFWREIWLKRVG